MRRSLSPYCWRRVSHCSFALASFFCFTSSSFFWYSVSRSILSSFEAVLSFWAVHRAYSFSSVLRSVSYRFVMSSNRPVYWSACNFARLVFSLSRLA